MPSIRDVARVAGVSPASVSRILNNDPDFHINENTRKRVIEIAQNLNYVKDKNKRGPKGKNGVSIGLILRHAADIEPNDPYFKNIHEGIIDEAERWRLNTQVVFRMHDRNKDWNSLKKFGAIILVGQMTDEAVKKIKSLNNNVILVDANPNIENCDYIQNDFFEKTSKILDYLYDLGHRNIVYIGGASSVVSTDGKTIPLKTESRAISYSNWMKIKDLDKYKHTYIGDWSIKAGFKLCNQMLKECHELPSAIIVGSDPMALGVYKSLKNHKINIPKQISIVSFDDVEMNRYLTPSLSSVYMNSREMGKTAVRLAKDMMIEDNLNSMPVTITCHSKLNLRDSVVKKFD